MVIRSQHTTAKQNIEQLRELFAAAPEVSARSAIKRVLASGAERTSHFLRLLDSNLRGARKVDIGRTCGSSSLTTTPRMFLATTLGGEWHPTSVCKRVGATHTIPHAPVRRRGHQTETFNVLRGGDYFFSPSALCWLGDLEEE